jgi:MoaA/NifB/PqqE/SkfB family radical SAM enzyme
MNLICLIRQGFTLPKLRELEVGQQALAYRLGEPFPPLWNKVLKSGAKFVLLIDEAVECRAHDLKLLLRILDASPKVDGITMDADAFAAVYGVASPAISSTGMNWTATDLVALPSWLALLRVERWTDESLQMMTPEFFLMAQAGKRRVKRTTLPRLELNARVWAGDLMFSLAEMFATDYKRFHAGDSANVIPPQFRVRVPGEQPVAAALRQSLAHPTFSILCPSRRPDFLREAVQSVVAQSWPEWELRIGVDGPKESHRQKAEQILAEFESDPRIHVRYHEHIGTGPTRRRLSEVARGDYLLPLDDDDRLPPHALERFAQEIKRTRGVPFLRGGTRVFGLFEAYLPPRRRYTVNNISNDIFEVNQPWVVRRDILSSLGGLEWDEQLKHAGEDSDLFLKADRASLPVSLLDEALYERRLSTLNQTLDCTAEECLKHIHYLYAKHDPVGWMLNGVHFQANSGPMIGMATEHSNPHEPAVVVCATRFMNFQQVGSREGVVLDLEITSLCNAVCSFCPREHLERSARFIKLETVERIAASLKEEGGNPLVVLCGIGESTLHPNLDQVVSTLAQAGAKVCTTTNGWNATPALVDKLVGAGLSELNVSLNATTADTHAFLMQMNNYERIVTGCREIADGCVRGRWPGFKLHVSFVVNDRNENEAEQFVAQWRHTGVSQIWLHPMTNRTGLMAEGCAPGDTERLAGLYSGDPMVKVDLFPEQERPANLCRIADGVDFISVDGDMLLCAQDYSARHRFGNISHSGLGQMHQEKLLRHLRGETANTCASCTFCPPSFKAEPGGIRSVVEAGML